MKTPAPAPRYWESHSLVIRLASQASLLPSVRVQARAFLDRYLPSSEEVDDMELIIDEALTNVVIHSCAGGEIHPVQLKISLDAMDWGAVSLLTLVFLDRGERGRFYRPSDGVERTRAKHAAGEQAGFGLVLLYRLMDHVAYQVLPGGTNRMELRKWFCQDPALLQRVRLLRSPGQDAEAVFDAEVGNAEITSRIPQQPATGEFDALDQIDRIFSSAWVDPLVADRLG